MSDIFIYDCATGTITIRPLTPEEEAQRELDEQAGEVQRLRMLAQERISRLRESEWTQLRDTPLTNARRTLWASYRQLLRDMLIGVDDFPTPPTGSEA